MKHSKDDTVPPHSTCSNQDNAMHMGSKDMTQVGDSQPKIRIMSYGEKLGFRLQMTLNTGNRM